LASKLYGLSRIPGAASLGSPGSLIGVLVVTRR
jgi:hypothetical protein